MRDFIDRFTEALEQWLDGKSLELIFCECRKAAGGDWLLIGAVSHRLTCEAKEFGTPFKADEDVAGLLGRVTDALKKVFWNE